jgi:integrase
MWGEGRLATFDLLKLKAGDVTFNGGVVETFGFEQQKTHKMVRCLLSEKTRSCLSDYIAHAQITGTLFPITRRRYCQLVNEWCDLIHVDKRKYGTHSLRRTKASHIYKVTRNLAAVQKLLGHTNLTHTQEYLGVTTDDAIELARQITI